jgi:hypothetical protein
MTPNEERQSVQMIAYTDFEDKVGTGYVLGRGSESPLTLTLVTAQELPGSMREGGGFRLEFRGPSEPLLEQGVYSLSQGAVDHDIFIVPIEQTADGSLYEAVFF